MSNLRSRLESLEGAEKGAAAFHLIVRTLIAPGVPSDPQTARIDGEVIQREANEAADDFRTRVEAIGWKRVQWAGASKVMVIGGSSTGGAMSSAGLGKRFKRWSGPLQRMSWW